MDFKDHFSATASRYAAYRPVYPAGLTRALATAAPARNLAWEAGCGSGQLSALLGDRFGRVLATDASAQQIAAARRHPRVEYRVAPAAVSGLCDRCADLCVAAQAAHWFDLDAYYTEVRRVARPGGLVALITYTHARVGPNVDPALDDLHAAVEPYWPPERRWVDARYATLPFPFDEVAFPDFEITARWAVERMVGYIGTWSATLAMLEAGGTDLLRPIHARIREAWGSGLRTVRWPIGLRVGRV